MKDMLDIIYSKLNDNVEINKHCGGRIKFYDYPPTADKNKCFVIIRPLDVPLPTAYGSNEILSVAFRVQIDVESSDRKECKLIQKEINNEMKKIKLFQQPNGMDEYFPETKKFVDARRYEGTTNLYDTNY